jgi:predicted RNA-binding protein with PIN domain
VYIIDGYNLLFNWSDEAQSLEIRRTHLVGWIQQVFQKINQCGMIVFDGAHRRDEEYGLSYESPMEIVYTPKGQTADQYIVEYAELINNKKSITVVTNDQSLKRHVSALGVKTMGNQAFLHWIIKRKNKKTGKKTVIRETSYQVERLLKIFEERLKADLDDF